MSDIEDLPALIDSYVEQREARLHLERQAEERKKLETKLKEQIEETLKAHNLSTGGGDRWRATIVPDNKPVCENWKALYEYVALTGAFDLLQRRLTETAVKARWEDNVVIPGITKFPITKLSITKV